MNKHLISAEDLERLHSTIREQADSLASMQAEVDELKAHVERLREAVLGVRPTFIPEGMILYARDKCVFCGSESMRCGDDIMHAKSCIIQSTPPQSLAALKRKHYGECVEICEQQKAGRNPSGVTEPMNYMAAMCAEAIKQAMEAIDE